MNKTPIQWTDFSVNPFRFRNLETGKVGHHCTKISPGCKNCYSGKMQEGPYLSGLAFIAENKPKGEFFLDEGVLQQVLRRRKPARIFWEDMSDMFLEDYPDEWIDRCFAVMALTPHLTHQVLTKRAERMREYMRRIVAMVGGQGFMDSPLATATRAVSFAAGHRLPGNAPLEWCDNTAAWEKDKTLCHTAGCPPRNVWLGVSVEDQQRADERIPLLLQTPAAVRFLSVEPLLGPVDLQLDEYVPGTGGERRHDLDWVIVGGESGPGARPLDIAWARSIVEQCAAAGVACFVKQLGARAFSGHSLHKQIHHRSTDGNLYWKLKDSKGGDPDEWPSDLRVRQMPGRTTPEVQISAGRTREVTRG